MKVLALISDRTVPTVTGTRVRNQFLWPAVQSQGVEVKILGVNLDRNENNPQGPPGLSSEFIKHHRSSFPHRLWMSLTRSFQEWPRSQEICDRVMQIDKEWRPDVIHAEELRMAYYLPKLQQKASSSRQSVTFHNVESDLLKKTGSSPFRWGAPLIEKIHQNSFARYEKKVIQSVDLCFAYSPIDREKYQSLYSGGYWDVTQNGTNASGIEPMKQAAESRLLIVGSLSYGPNIHGLNWFLKEVHPQLPKDFTVVVAGSRAPEEYKVFLRSHAIEFIDTPSDLAPEFQKCALCIVPVFKGSGTRGKILEALAHERMVITTALGNEGLPFTSENGVVLAEDKDAFIREITYWSQQGKERQGPANKGRQLILDKYDWQTVAKNLITSWRQLCAS